MKKCVLLLLLVGILALCLTGCGGGASVTDVQVSELAEVSGLLKVSSDMQPVEARLLVKNAEGKTMVTSVFQLLDSIKGGGETPFSFNLFAAETLSGATLSYSPFSNIYEQMAQDTITCEILENGKALTSFAIDGSAINVQDALQNLETAEPAAEE